MLLLLLLCAYGVPSGVCGVSGVVSGKYSVDVEYVDIKGCGVLCVGYVVDRLCGCSGCGSHGCVWM